MIGKFLDVGTSAITLGDSEKLPRRTEVELDDAMDPWIAGIARVIPHAYGWWVHVTQDESADTIRKALVKDGFSPSFVKLMLYARRKKCFWINIDRDGEVTEEELDSNEW